MAYLDRRTQRWVVEKGDLVYWRENVEDQGRNFTPARVVEITDRHVYLTSGRYDWSKPMGIVEGETKVWRILLGAAPLHVVPRVACWLARGKVHFDWERLPIVPSGYRKAS